MVDHDLFADILWPHLYIYLFEKSLVGDIGKAPEYRNPNKEVE